MSRKRFTPEQILVKRREAEVALTDRGPSMPYGGIAGQTC